jgi:hypothetical protein
MTNANLTVKKKSSVGQGCTNMGQLCMVVSNVEFVACQSSDTWNFEVSPRFFEIDGHLV